MISQRYASFAHFYGTMAKFRQLQALAAKVQLADEHDRWVVLDSTIIFNVSSAYKSLIGDGNGCAALNWIWKGCCQDKHKVLCCLLIHNRLYTRAMLQRKHFFMNDYTCIMCDQGVLETRNHLFFQRPFALHCWSYVCPQWAPPLDFDIH
jgi:hypothetical protein